MENYIHFPLRYDACIICDIENMAFVKYLHIMYDNIAISDNIFALMIQHCYPLSALLLSYVMYNVYTKYNTGCCENNIENSLTPSCRTLGVHHLCNGYTGDIC